MRKSLIILFQIISWIIFPPVFIYSVFMSNKIKKANKILCSISVLFSPFTIIFLFLLFLVFWPTRQKDLTSNLDDITAPELQAKGQYTNIIIGEAI
jgi:energy-coupling factor transporter transmembrane protein EcfT